MGTWPVPDASEGVIGLHMRETALGLGRALPRKRGWESTAGVEEEMTG
jgi:hypothetical protein